MDSLRFTHIYSQILEHYGTESKDHPYFTALEFEAARVYAGPRDLERALEKSGASSKRYEYRRIEYSEAGGKAGRISQVCDSLERLEGVEEFKGMVWWSATQGTPMNIDRRAVSFQRTITNGFGKKLFFLPSI